MKFKKIEKALSNKGFNLVKYSSKLYSNMKKKYSVRYIKIYGKNFILYKIKPVNVELEYENWYSGIPLKILTRCMTKFKILDENYCIFYWDNHENLLKNLEKELEFKINIKLLRKKVLRVPGGTKDDAYSRASTKILC